MTIFGLVKSLANDFKDLNCHDDMLYAFVAADAGGWSCACCLYIIQTLTCSRQLQSDTLHVLQWLRLEDETVLARALGI